MSVRIKLQYSHLMQLEISVVIRALREAAYITRLSFRPFLQND